jgi:DNA-binding transcriptional MerR regulator
MRIGELSERTGVSVPAIRYYEALGLLRRPSRSHAGHRFYGTTVLERLHFIQQAKALTLRLLEIRELLRVSDRGECPCERAKQLLLQHLADLQRTIRHEQGLVRQIERVATSLLPHDRAVQPEGVCLYLMPVPKRARRPSRRGHA